MKIGVCSDLHLEFGDLNLKNEDNVDVLILSGDILVESDLQIYDRRQIEMGFMQARSVSFHEFFQRVCFQFPHVIYVAGNHEHYHGDFAHTISNLKRKLAHHTNLHILDREVFDLGDVRFIGSTLWTDMNKEDPITIQRIKGYMNDYRIIEDSSEQVHFKTPVFGRKEDGSTDFDNVVSMEFHTRNAKFSPEKSIVEHRAMMQFIKDSIDSRPDMPWVVVGHHAPSKLSTKPRYQKDVIVNGAYSSDLSEFILDHPQIKLWTHGHTHEDFDYMIGSTRVVCNPRGYIHYEDRADRFELKVIEV